MKTIAGVVKTERRFRITRKPDHFLGTFFAMGGPCEVLVDSADSSLAAGIVEIAALEAWRIEDKFSRYLPGNIIDRINSSDGAGIEVDGETANLLDFAANLTEISDGRFDITSGVLREIWSFDGKSEVPDAVAVEKVRARIGWHKIVWCKPALTLLPAMQVDFGGIGKEYAVDKCAAMISTHSDTACLVNFGGDIFATRAPGGSAGWQVGIEAPDSNETQAKKLIRLKNGGLATSGDARRFLLKDGVRYGHILDPTTGWPIRNAPRSITVAADTCTQAGMLATLAMLKGKEAESFLQQQPNKAWCFR